MSKVYEIAFQMGGQITSTFSKSMKGANSALGSLQKQITSLNNQQGDLGNLQKLQKSVGTLSREFNQAQQKAQMLGKELAQTANPTKKQTQEFNKARTAAAKLKTRLGEQRSELHKLRTTMGATGKSTRDLVNDQKALAAQAEKARKAQANLQATMAKQQANIATRENKRGQLLDAAGLAVSLAAPIREAIKFESAMADVNKVVQQTSAQSKQMGLSIVEMSRRIPLTADAIAQIVAAGGQAGIARKDLEGFAESAAKMGVAFDITAGEAGEMMAKWRTSFGVGQKEVEKLADQINYLSNTSAASAPLISDVVTRVGGLGKIAGVNSGQVAALGSALVAVGAPSEVAATGIQNMLLSMTAGASATAKQQKAFAALGFETKNLAYLMQEDAEGAINSVFEAIKNLSAEERPAVLTELFGKESIKSIGQLANNSDLLAKTFKTVGDSSQYAGSMQKEFAARSATTENNLILLGNRVRALGISLGNILLPALNSIVGFIGPMVDGLANLANEFPFVTKVIVGATAALIALKVASIAGGYAWTFVVGAGLKLRRVIDTVRVAYLLNTGAVNANTVASKKSLLINKAMIAGQTALAAVAAKGGLMVLAKTAIPAAIAGFKALSVAVLTNPIGLIIAGIAAAALLIYKHWQPIKAFFVGFWDGLTASFAPLQKELARLMVSLGPLGKAFTFVWQKVKTVVSWFGSLFEQTQYSQESLASAANSGKKFGSVFAAAIKIAISPVTALIKVIGMVRGALDNVKSFFDGFSLYDSGYKMLSTLADGIKSAVSVPVNAVKGALSRVRDYLPFSDAKVGPFSELTKSGSAIMSTLAQGVDSNNTLQGSISNKLGAAPIKPMSSMASGATSNTNNQSTVTLKIDNISVSVGGGAQTEQQARAGVASGIKDAVKELEKTLQQKRRLSYE